LTYGWEHAQRINRPLNLMISIRPFEDLDPKTHCEFAARFRHKLCIYARQHGFAFVAAWARECNRDGTGEHLHVLMHVPRKHCRDLEEKIIGWFPEPGAADVRPANQKVFVTEKGKRMSAIGYLAKQMTPQAWYKRGLIRKAGGPILGKRGGVTRNIGPKAIDAYFNARAFARRAGTMRRSTWHMPVAATGPGEGAGGNIRNAAVHKREKESNTSGLSHFAPRAVVLDLPNDFDLGGK
jgi:hypothetical protein